MKVKLTQPRATDKGPEQIGQEIEVNEAEGQRMLARGQCEIVKPEKGGNAQRQ